MRQSGQVLTAIAALFFATTLWSCSTPDWLGRKLSAVDPDLLQIELNGNTKISYYELIRASEDSLIDLSNLQKPYLADDAAFFMEDAYREKGFHRAKVQYAFEPGEPASVTFNVTEGPQAVIADVLVTALIELLGGDAGHDVRGDHVEGRRGQLAGPMHAGKRRRVVQRHLNIIRLVLDQFLHRYSRHTLCPDR